MKQSNKGLIAILFIIIFLFAVIMGLLFGKNDKNQITNSLSDKYEQYLSNLKTSIENNYEEYSNNVINSDSIILGTNYNFTITKNLELLFTTSNNQYEKYKVSENVLNMFLIEEGNGGFKYLYFIKTDGSLNKLCVDCLKEDSEIKIEVKDNKYIINVTQGLFDYEVSGARGPIFIDIDGNIST